MMYGARRVCAVDGEVHPLAAEPIQEGDGGHTIPDAFERRNQAQIRLQHEYFERRSLPE
jgi:hypothetical protein